MALRKVYGAIISPFIDSYKSAKNATGRTQVVKNAAEAVLNRKDLLEDNGVGLPKDLQTAIARYIKAEIKKEATTEDGDPKPIKIKQIYTIRDVIKQNYRDLVEAEIPYDPTDKEYIGSYQRAVSKVIESMGDEDLEEAEKIVNLWNQQGAPSDLQLKTAKRKLPNDIKKKVEEWKFSSGALVMCLVAYSDGQDVQSFHVESSPIMGNTFTNSCNDWRDGTYDNFKEWAVRQFGHKELEDEDEADVPVHMQKAKDIEFKTDKHGILVLPPIEDFRTIRQRQRVVRGYIGAVYRKFTGNKRSAFPFSLASQTGQKIFSTDCVPENFVLSDPDHLTGFQISNLYHHWLKRQKKKLAPFIVLNASPNHIVVAKKSEKAKGKQKMDYVPVDSDTVEENEDESKQLEDGDASEDGFIPVGSKFGPPISSKKIVPSTTQQDELPSQVAGPSKLGSGKLSVTKKDPKISDRKKSESKKRKPEGDLETGKSPKRLKDGGAKKVGIELGTKRRHEDEQDPTAEGSRNPKRKRLRTPEDPIYPQARVKAREASRVKEFPAGNLATSASRIAFLRSLCNLPKFLALVDMVEPVPKPSVMPSDYPSWASWNSREVYLPANFHTSASFKNAISILKKSLNDSSILQGGKVDAPLLFLGLVYREVSRSIEIEPGTSTKVPDHLVNSYFGIKELNQIEKVLNGVQIPSNQ